MKAFITTLTAVLTLAAVPALAQDKDDKKEPCYSVNGTPLTAQPKPAVGTEPASDAPKVPAAGTAKEAPKPSGG